jgi:hypothetical protein
MNEVNIKLILRFPKKKKKLLFSGRIRNFYRRKTDYDEKFCVSSKLYFMRAEIQPGVMIAQKREIKKSRVTYLLIKFFLFSVNKYTFKGFYMEIEVIFAIIQYILSNTCCFMNRKVFLRIRDTFFHA